VIGCVGYSVRIEPRSAVGAPPANLRVFYKLCAVHFNSDYSHHFRSAERTLLVVSLPLGTRSDDGAIV